ncbi:hypothetical protein ACFFLZ_02525 [Photobacterium aphoticum]|uniref:Lipoprotein n=1 Tax=Photobacterium aphoticum TaxID=754436 RepID=A0A0J1GTL0_9GAMM|nr:hypothetical protein [Photobacterium aphoticum]KLV03058.1 hypothetical protein ABT58_00585 [Photobacterium aphoticum]PSU57991.1 hypothetical protein C9I90_07930 [Photobacterium aphoticum]GHA60938.1 hypothetical protein GCM10007086_38470 [Photobacterium aphoticum]
MNKTLKTGAAALFFIFGLTACGSPVINKQTGISEQQIIFIVGEDLIDYTVSVGNIHKHKITHIDLEDDSVQVSTSADSNLQNSDVLKIIVSQGTNHLEIQNDKNETIYKNDIYLSQGQSTLVNVK